MLEKLEVMEDLGIPGYTAIPKNAKELALLQKGRETRMSELSKKVCEQVEADHANYGRRSLLMHRRGQREAQRVFVPEGQSTELLP